MSDALLLPANRRVSRWLRYRHEWLTGAYILLYFLALYLAATAGELWATVANLGYFPMGAITIWAQARLARDSGLHLRTRRAWALLAAASAATWIGGIAWTVWLSDHPGAFTPLWSDTLDAVYIPLAIAGFLTFPANPRFTWRDRRVRLDALLIALGGIGLSWSFGLRPLFEAPTEPDFVIQLVTVLGDWTVVLAASIAYLRAACVVTRRAVAIAFAAHVFFILSDFFWIFRQDTYAPGHWVDAVWFSAWILRWVAARYATHAARRDESVDGMFAYRSGIAPTAFVAGAYSLLVYVVLIGDSSDAVSIALGTAAMTTLLLVRQRVELAENLRLSHVTAIQAARFRSLVTYASDFVLLVDGRYEVVYASPSADRAGIASVGCSFPDLIHPDDQEAVLAWFDGRSSLLTGAPRRCRFRGSSARWGDVELRAQDLRSDPHVRGFVVNGRDITDEVALESRVRHAQKLAALHDMAGRIAHAFNNALASIQGHAELLAQDAPVSGTIKDDVDAIRAAAERGSGITRQLLGFSGRHVIQAVPLDPARVTTDLVPMLERLVPANVSLAVDIDDDAGTVLFDRAQFEQVLVNLVANAGDAMTDGGKICVSVAPTQSQGDPDSAGDACWVRIRVSDAGRGIPRETLARIFEPFFSTKQPGRGTGLGLAMVKAIVSRAGGTVGVESEPGRGTTFSILVPTTERPELQAMDTTPEDSHVPSGGVVLLVDDDAAVRRASKRMLERAGYTVVEASGGAMAIDFARRGDLRLDLLLTDLMMPGVSGRDVIAAFRQLRPRLPIVCVTGFAAESDAAPLAPEVHAIVAKPFTAAALVHAVASAMSKTSAAA